MLAEFSSLRMSRGAAIFEWLKQPTAQNLPVLHAFCGTPGDDAKLNALCPNDLRSARAGMSDAKAIGAREPAILLPRCRMATGKTCHHPDDSARLPSVKRVEKRATRASAPRLR